MESQSTATQPQQSNGAAPFDDILLQVNFLDSKQKNDIETGKKIAQRIYATQTTNSGSLNFFQGRSARWIVLEKWAKGTQDMTEFLDFFNVSDGNKAYVKIDMTPIAQGAQFMVTLVDSMCKTEEYPCVEAIDDDSLEEKQQRKLDALFRMHEVDNIDKAQQLGGVQLEQPNAYVPNDELSAQVYFELEDKLPKEIRFEKSLEKTLLENQYEKLLKRQLKYDLCIKNFEAAKIELDIHGKKRIRKCIPQNCIYNYFISDTGRLEMKYFGEIYNMKISDIRIKYGKSPNRPNGLTEKQLYDLARFSTTNNTGLGFNFPWMDSYTVFNNRRPWDDYAVYIFDFEIAISDDEYYTSKKDNFGKENIMPKKGVPQPQSEATKVLKREKIRWFNGIYAPYAKEMIYWGLPDLVLFPYTNTQEGLSNYVVNIPFNNGDYVPSLFERGMETLKEYAITKLKRKQLIAKLRPSGVRIDIESARNIDLGTGNTIPWEEIVRIYDQTGNELWSSIGLNPNERATPSISQTAPDDSIQKIIGLTSLLQSQIGELRQLWGVPLYRDGGDVGDRTAAQLAEGQQTASNNVTDFIDNAHNQFMDELLYRLCLLDWQKIVKTEPESADDLINTRFQVYARMKMTEYQKEQLERSIQIAMATIDQSTGKPSLSFKDAFRIRQIDNYKLANLYLANTIEENERRSEKDKQQRAAENLAAQRASAQDAAKAQDELAQKEQQAKQSMEDNKGKNEKQKILLQFMADFYLLAATPVKPAGEGAPTPAQPSIPPELKPLFGQVITNVALPLVQQNKEMKEDILMEQVQQMMEQQAAQQQQQQMGGDQMQMAPQQQMQPQMQMQ